MARAASRQYVSRASAIQVDGGLHLTRLLDDFVDHLKRQLAGVALLLVGGKNARNYVTAQGYGQHDDERRRDELLVPEPGIRPPLVVTLVELTPHFASILLDQLDPSAFGRTEAVRC